VTIHLNRCFSLTFQRQYRLEVLGLSMRYLLFVAWRLPYCYRYSAFSFIPVSLKALHEPVVPWFLFNYLLKGNLHYFNKYRLKCLRVCPREDQAGVTHAISPISLKLSQMIKVIKNALEVISLLEKQQPSCKCRCVA